MSDSDNSKNSEANSDPAKMKPQTSDGIGVPYVSAEDELPTSTESETETAAVDDYTPKVVPAITDEKQRDALRENIVKAMKTVYDPEIPVDIYELGLIYTVDVKDDGNVIVDMTLTSPSCPAAEVLPAEVQMRTREVDGVADCVLNLVWDPTWTQDMMSESARLELGMMW